MVLPSAGTYGFVLRNCIYFYKDFNASHDRLIRCFSSFFSPKKIVAFGNALLDHTIFLDDKSLLEKYQLEEGSIGLLNNEKIQAILKDTCGTNLEKCLKVPGGSVLNSVRILKQLGTNSTYFGAVGIDENGQELGQLLTEQCIDARLEKVENHPTGVCICLIYEMRSTKHAHIGASEKFSLEFLKREARGTEVSHGFLRPNDKKQILYVEGYFVPKHGDIMDYIVKNFITGRRRLALNLSAPFIVQECFPEIMHLCNNAFFIIGNLKEFTTLKEKMGVPSIEAAARQIMQHGTVVKIIVVTKDADGVDLITNYNGESCKPGDITYESFNVTKVENPVDDTGAGDAFAAAFLHAWLEKRQLSECIRFACDIAAKVVTQIGCTLPTDSPPVSSEQNSDPSN